MPPQYNEFTLKQWRNLKAVRRIAIIGGTFDPVHTGHLFIAEEARCRFNLDEVIFIPAAAPPHKHRPDLSPAEDRYAMVLLATASNPFFSVSRIELERPGPSFTIDTLQALRALYGEETALYFISGADTVLEIPTWHRPEAIIRECRLIAATRPGYDLGLLQRHLPPAYLPVIDLLPLPGMDISSTDIRRRVHEHRSIAYLTPEAVADYIRKKHLYEG